MPDRDNAQRAEPSIAVAEIDLAYLQTIRERMPVQAHARPDVYRKDVDVHACEDASNTEHK